MQLGISPETKPVPTNTSTASHSDVNLEESVCSGLEHPSPSESPAPESPDSTPEFECFDNYEEAEDWTELVRICNVKDLISWAVRNNITRRARNELLAILRAFDPEELRKLPKDFRSLFKNSLSADIHNLNDGAQIAYFGIQRMLNHPGIFGHIQKHLQLQKQVKLSIHIDGLSLFRSSRTELWPVLGKLGDKIFVIAVHCGVGKINNTDCDELLRLLVTEIRSLQRRGIVIQNTEYDFTVSMICADAPARAQIARCKYPSGYSSCIKCHVHGIYSGGSVRFPSVDDEPRTHEQFVVQSDHTFHTGKQGVRTSTQKFVHVFSPNLVQF